jgi:hypothetical protein
MYIWEFVEAKAQSVCTNRPLCDLLSNNQNVSALPTKICFPGRSAFFHSHSGAEQPQHGLGLRHHQIAGFLVFVVIL